MTCWKMCTLVYPLVSSNYSCQARQKRWTCYTKIEVICMLSSLIDNIFLDLSGHIFQQVINILIGRNWPRISISLFQLYSESHELFFKYGTDFLFAIPYSFGRQHTNDFNFCVARSPFLSCLTRIVWRHQRVNRSRKSEDRQHNSQKKKRTRGQLMIHKTLHMTPKDRATRTLLQIGDELRFPGWVSYLQV
jgi:hypothetical protein